MYTNDYDGDDDYIDEWNPSSSDQVSWYGSDYEQQDHDLDILDKLREDTQELIERQNNSTLLKRKNEKYSQDLITSLKNERYLRRSEILLRPDTFFEDIQQFRDEYEQYTKGQEPKEGIKENNYFPPPENCKKYMKSQKLEEKYLVDDEPYYGYYSLNKRLFPVNENKCYLYPLNKSNLSEKEKGPGKIPDEYPIKISIKKDQFKPVKKNNKHHRRKSYDPYNSISLNSYLCKGYDTMGQSSRNKESNTVSLNKELNGKNPKEITFNQQYYFY
ncbi:hypothetical protein LY90DRAFT_664993 [Neocallimastix californiae]|jgi:hypothetical protein|uniref:Uncharacterized protein n=1 Tax=Neocallimastix californiae TaxID=1754190 RepID=A0A1Y2F2Z3_9FUNG|nr:hypothetical protein LY90DRAFT_664993 [Neocallimastix californiae]|eukprot:ORY78268.1 hypothetical protein LY90DRAFT_664993 [Neocallimastix californiae]